MTIHYQDQSVTLHAGDCLDILRQLPDASVDAVVTDPPYNLSFMAKPWDAYNGREDAGFAYWLSGLIDGEGHFAIKGHARGTFAPAFALKMRADERGTLERIKRSLGVGTISDEKREPNPMVKYPLRATNTPTTGHGARPSASGRPGRAATAGRRRDPVAAVAASGEDGGLFDLLDGEGA